MCVCERAREKKEEEEETSIVYSWRANNEDEPFEKLARCLCRLRGTPSELSCRNQRQSNLLVNYVLFRLANVDVRKQECVWKTEPSILILDFFLLKETKEVYICRPVITKAFN